MKILRNPYDNRKPVTNPALFYNRREEVVKIMKQIGSQSCSIYGEPRIGRTSLLHYLAHPDGAQVQPEIRYYLGNPEDYLFVLIEFQNLPTRNSLGLWRYLFGRVSEEAKKVGRESDELRICYQKCRESRDNYEVQIGFEQYLRTLTGRVVLLFDDFEIIVNNFEANDAISSTQKLRSLTQSAELQDKLNYIVMSLDPIEQIFAKRGLENITSPLFNVLLDIGSLGLLDEESAYRIIHEPLRELGTEAPKFTEQDVNFVLQLAGRHPDLIKITSFYLFEAKLHGEVNYAQVQKTIEYNPHVRWLMGRLDERVKEVEKREGLALCDTLISITKGLKPTTPQVLTKLEERGIIDTTTDRPRIFSALFCNFIRRQNTGNKESLTSPISQAVNLKPTSHSIQMNGNLIKLTALEFKLFHHLANNIGQTCGREELIKVLWNETPPTSRDALEQIVKRLRKKIESDPERPQLLLAVRGQGYLLRSSEITVTTE